MWGILGLAQSGEPPGTPTADSDMMGNGRRQRPAKDDEIPEQSWDDWNDDNRSNGRGDDSNTSAVIHELSDELATVKLQLVEMQGEVRFLEQQRDTLKQELDSYRHKSLQTSANLEAKHHGEMEMQHELIQELQQSNNKLLWSNRELQEKVELLEQGAGLDMMRDQMKESDALVMAAREETEAMQASLTASEGALATVAAERAELSSSLVAARQQLKEREAKVEALEAQLETVQSEHAVWEDKVSAIRVHAKEIVGQWQAAHYEVSAERDQLKQRLSEEAEKCRSIEEDLQATLERLSSSKQEAGQLLTQLQQRQAELEAMRAEADGHQKASAEAQARGEQLQAELESQREDLAQASQTRAALEAQLLQAQMVQDSLATDLHAVQAQMQAAGHAAKAELQRLSDKLETVSAQAAASAAAKASAEQELVAAREEVATVRESLASAQQGAVAAEGRWRALLAEEQEQRAALELSWSKGSRQQLEELNATITAVSESKAALEKDLQESKQQQELDAQQYQSQLDVLQSELQEALLRGITAEQRMEVTKAHAQDVVAQWESALEDAKRDLAQTARRLSEAEQALGETEAKLVATEAELATARDLRTLDSDRHHQVVEELRRKHEAAHALHQQELQAALDDVEALKQVAGELQLAKDSEEQRARALEAHLAALQAAPSPCDSCSALRTELSTARAELSATHQAVTAAQAQLAASQQLHSSVQDSNAQLAAALDALQLEHARSQEAQGGLQRELAVAQAGLATAQSELTAAQRALAGAESRARVSAEEAAELCAQMEATFVEEATKAQVALDTAHRQLAELSEQLLQANASLADQRARADWARAEVEEAMGEKASLQEKLIVEQGRAQRRRRTLEQQALLADGDDPAVLRQAFATERARLVQELEEVQARMRRAEQLLADEQARAQAAQEVAAPAVPPSPILSGNSGAGMGSTSAHEWQGSQHTSASGAEDAGMDLHGQLAATMQERDRIQVELEQAQAELEDVKTRATTVVGQWEAALSEVQAEKEELEEQLFRLQTEAQASGQLLIPQQQSALQETEQELQLQQHMLLPTAQQNGFAACAGSGEPRSPSGSCKVGQSPIAMSGMGYGTGPWTELHCCLSLLLAETAGLQAQLHGTAFIPRPVVPLHKAGNDPSEILSPAGVARVGCSPRNQHPSEGPALIGMNGRSLGESGVTTRHDASVRPVWVGSPLVTVHKNPPVSRA